MVQPVEQHNLTHQDPQHPEVVTASRERGSSPHCLRFQAARPQHQQLEQHHQQWRHLAPREYQHPMAVEDYSAPEHDPARQATSLASKPDVIYIRREIQKTQTCGGA